MKLEKESLRQIAKVSIGTGLALCGMFAVFFLLSLLGVGTLDHRVVLGGVLGTLAAILNFVALCLTVQKAAKIMDAKRRQAMLQVSYHSRLLLQAGWVVTAFLLPGIHTVAAALPLLFPSGVIFFLRSRAWEGSAKER
jgi:hypothetical protein